MAVVASTALHAVTSDPSAGRLGVVYEPTHNWAYPVFGGWPQVGNLREAMHKDLALLSKYVTHIRTPRAQYFGIEVTPIAATYGLKVYLGVDKPAWTSSTKREIEATVTALRDYSEAVEAVIVGDDSLGDESRGGSSSLRVGCANLLHVLMELMRQGQEIRRLVGNDGDTAPHRIRVGTSVSYDWFSRLTRELAEALPRPAACDQFLGNLSTFDVLGMKLWPLFVNQEDPLGYYNGLWNKTTTVLPSSQVYFLETSVAEYLRVRDPVMASRVYDALLRWDPPRGHLTMAFWNAAFGTMASSLWFERGFFSDERERVLEGLPRPRRPGDDPVKKRATMRPDHCPMGKYHQVIEANARLVQLCLSSGYSFRNPTKFDERSLPAACGNPFCVLVIHELRKIPSVDPKCPFHERMTRKMLDEWILEPFRTHCTFDHQYVVEEAVKNNPMGCMRSIGDSYRNKLLMVRENGTTAEWCENVSDFSLSNIHTEGKFVALSQEVLVTMCGQPSCELLMLQMATTPAGTSCGAHQMRTREWIVANVLIPFYDGCYHESQMAADYYDTANRKRKRHPRLPWLPQIPDDDVSTPTTSHVPTPTTPKQTAIIEPPERRPDESEDLVTDNVDKMTSSSRAPSKRPTDCLGQGSSSSSAINDIDSSVPLSARDRGSQYARPKISRSPVSSPLDSQTPSAASHDVEDTELIPPVPLPTGQIMTKRQSHDRLSLLSVTCGLVAMLTLCLIVIWMRRRRRTPASDSHYASMPASSVTARHASRPTQQATGDGPKSLYSDALLTRLFIPPDDLRELLLIGSGGQALVYLVEYRPSRSIRTQPDQQQQATTAASTATSDHDPPPPQLLAAKRLSRRAAINDINVVVDFVDEIKIVASLRHPNIVSLVGVTWTTGYDLQALFEFIPGGDLCTHLKSTPRYGWTKSKLQVALDVIDALAYVHALDPPLVHRDIKSRNVLLAPLPTMMINADEGESPENCAHFRAKLTDFGVSRRHSTRETMTTGVGTSRWLAPEVILGGGTYDQSCDVYSFGVLLSELDTHCLPFADRQTASGDLVSDLVVLQMIAVDGATPTFDGRCPEDLLAVAHECLTYDPRQRPTAEEVSRRLREVRDCDDVRMHQT